MGDIAEADGGIGDEREIDGMARADWNAPAARRTKAQIQTLMVCTNSTNRTATIVTPVLAKRREDGGGRASTSLSKRAVHQAEPFGLHKDGNGNGDRRRWQARDAPYPPHRDAEDRRSRPKVIASPPFRIQGKTGGFAVAVSRQRGRQGLPGAMTSTTRRSHAGPGIHQNRPAMRPERP